MNQPIFSADREVAFQDVDAAGIVFFVRFFEYCHDVFFAFMSSRGISMPEVLAKGSWGVPLAHAEADFAMPLRFGDRITVRIAALAIGATSMQVDYQVVNARDKNVCNVKLVHVFIDRASMRPCPPPPEVRAALSEITTA